MKQNNNDGTSNGQEENNHDGFRVELAPFLRTKESLPQQIDPNALYIGLPSGWVDIFECEGDVDGVLYDGLPSGQVAILEYIESAPRNHVVLVKSGKELLEMVR